MQKTTIRIPVYRRQEAGDPNAGDSPAAVVYAFGSVLGTEDGGPTSPAEGDLIGYVEAPEGSEVKETYGAPALFLATSALGIDAEEAISLAKERCYGMSWSEAE